MARTGGKKHPNNLQERLKRLGFESTAFCPTNYSNAERRARLIKTKRYGIIEGSTTRERKCRQLFRLLNHRGEVLHDADTLSELVSALEGGLIKWGRDV